MRLILLAILQSALLASGQVMLKIALHYMPAPAFTWHFVRTMLSIWQFAVCGLCYLSASLLWMYIVKTYPLSQSYPMVSLSFVFGMIAAILVFREVVNLQQWIGMTLIIIGCVLIAK